MSTEKCRRCDSICVDECETVAELEQERDQLKQQIAEWHAAARPGGFIHGLHEDVLERDERIEKLTAALRTIVTEWDECGGVVDRGIGMARSALDDLGERHRRALEAQEATCARMERVATREEQLEQQGFDGPLHDCGACSSMEDCWKGPDYREYCDEYQRTHSTSGKLIKATPVKTGKSAEGDGNG
jgi:hypothetical protein